jgi:hypothetical protein
VKKNTSRSLFLRGQFPDAGTTERILHKTESAAIRQESTAHS